ncbi:hypothetical protein Aduo_003438 [Ancylostoma duodenale]
MMIYEKSQRSFKKTDDNKAQPDQISINYQGHTGSSNAEDHASKEWGATHRLFSTKKNEQDLFIFFTKVDPSLLEKPSFSQFIAMMDNFNRQTGVAEPRVSVQEEQQEISAFLDTVLASRPWQTLYSFLNQRRQSFATTPVTFRQWMLQLWFHHYSRAKGKADTSGFEHVFMGEEKNDKVSGLHNWVRFYQLERNATENFDYKGFIVKRAMSACNNVMAELKFSWKGDLKRSGSLLIGTSPEFDMALYTLCFLLRGGKEMCNVELDGCPLSITGYDMVQNNKVYISTIYPAAGPTSSACGRA